MAESDSGDRQIDKKMTQSGELLSLIETLYQRFISQQTEGAFKKGSDFFSISSEFLADPATRQELQTLLNKGVESAGPLLRDLLNPFSGFKTTPRSPKGPERP